MIACAYVYVLKFNNMMCAGATGSGPSREEQEWQALPVSQIAEGDSVWVCLQGAARHTGIAITESISEK